MTVTDHAPPPGTPDGDVAVDLAADDAPTGSHRQRHRPLTGPIVLLMSFGLVIGAFAVSRARSGDLGSLTQALFWIGLLVVFIPGAARVIARSTGAAERVVLALAVPLLLQLSRVVLYPIFAYHDEFIHLNTLRLIGDNNHLFDNNPLLPVASYYPGLEIVTDGVHSLTGLSLRVSAVVVLLLARLIAALAIIGLVGGITGSTRAACVASLIYTTNPQAIFFNAQFSYQSLALPLALFVAYAFYSRNREARSWRAMLLPALGLLAVVVTHHLTAMLLVAAFGIWAAADAVVQRRARAADPAVSGHDVLHPSETRGLLALFVGGAVVVVAWAALPGNPILGYLRTIVTSSVGDIKARLSGEETHKLFQSSGGITSPLWERAATVAAILIVFVAILPAFGLVRSWIKQRRRDSILILLGLVALAYPIIPLGHVTPGTGEVTDRASGFLFLGVGLAVAVGPVMRIGRRIRCGEALLTTLLAIVFVGGVVLGAGPTVGQLPGPFLVSADARSTDAANLAAAHWERENLPVGTRIFADRDGGLLAAGIGGMHTVTHVDSGIDASRILLAPDFTDADVALIRRAGIEYVIVDERDATALPNVRVYIENGEYGGDDRTEPVPLAALRKLASVPGVQRVYSNGPVVIYDVRALA